MEGGIFEWGQGSEIDPTLTNPNPNRDPDSEPQATVDPKWARNAAARRRRRRRCCRRRRRRFFFFFFLNCLRFVLFPLSWSLDISRRIEIARSIPDLNDLLVVAHVSGWEPYNLRGLAQCFFGLDLPYKADLARPLTTINEESYRWSTVDNLVCR